MTDHEFVEQMCEPGGYAMTQRNRLVESVKKDELPVIEEALREVVKCVDGDLIYPDELEVDVEDIALLWCRIDMDFPRFSAKFELRAQRRTEEGNLIYSVQEINK